MGFGGRGGKKVHHSLLLAQKKTTSFPFLFLFFLAQEFLFLAIQLSHFSSRSCVDVWASNLPLLSACRVLSFIHKMALAWIQSATLYVGGRRQEKCCGRWLKINKTQTSSAWKCSELGNAPSRPCKPAWESARGKVSCNYRMVLQFFAWMLLQPTLCAFTS